jgi:hypothetical protein
MGYVPPQPQPPEPFPVPEGDDQTNCPFCAQIADRGVEGWQCREIAAHNWPAPVPPPAPVDVPVSSGYYEALAKKKIEDARREQEGGQTSS